MALLAHFKCYLFSIETRIVFFLILMVFFKHGSALTTSRIVSIRSVLIELLYLVLYRLSGIRFDEACMRRSHSRAVTPNTFMSLLLIIHVVAEDFLALEINLEHSWEEGSPWCNLVVFVREIIPLLPLVDEDAQIW